MKHTKSVALCFWLLIPHLGFSESTSFWVTPFFMQIPWKTEMVKFESDDTRAFASKDDSPYRLVVDYGEAHLLQSAKGAQTAIGNLRCKVESVAPNKVLATCKKSNDGSRVLVLILSADSDPRDTMRNILASLRSVGHPSKLKVLSINVGDSTAVIEDESGLKRTVRKGEYILENYGVVQTVSRSSIKVQQIFYRRGDIFTAKAKIVYLHLQKARKSI